MRLTRYIETAGGSTFTINLATVAVVIGAVIKLGLDISTGNAPAIGADVLAIFSALGLPSIFPNPAKPTT